MAGVADLTYLKNYLVQYLVYYFDSILTYYMSLCCYLTILDAWYCISLFTKLLCWLFLIIDTHAWTALINAYGINGHGQKSLDLYNQMKQKSIPPNRVTFISVINACSHSGLVKEAMEVFNSMASNHGITPDDSHTCCMVDAFSRSGLLMEAFEFAVKVNSIRQNIDCWFY